MSIQHHPDDHYAEHLAATHHGVTTAQVNDRVDDFVDEFERFRHRVTSILAVIGFLSALGYGMGLFWLFTR